MIFYHSRSGSVERKTSLACKFCLPISGLKGFSIFYHLNYAYIGKISPKYYHNLKWVNKLKGAL